MRAGSLDRTITIERHVISVNEYGVPDEVWSPVATVRAELMDLAAEEGPRPYGIGSEAIVGFRLRWLPGLTLADRVDFEGQQYDIKEIKEVGRRKTTELRCVARPSA
jgi:head-tail adaptor